MWRHDTSNPHFQVSKFVGLRMIEVNGEEKLVFLTHADYARRDAGTTGSPVDFDIAGDISGNKVYFLSVFVLPPQGQSRLFHIHISVQNVREDTDIAATFINEFVSEAGVPRNLDPETQIHTANSDQPANTTALQFLKAQTLGALFGIAMPGSVTPDMTVLSDSKLMLELTAAGGTTTKYIFTLTTFEMSKGQWRDPSIVNNPDLEFADKGLDGDGNEIVDIQFPNFLVKSNKRNTDSNINMRFNLKVEKLNTDGSVDTEWTPPNNIPSEKTFQFTILPATSAQTSGQGGGRAMTEVVSYDDFSPDAGMEELGAPLAEVL